MRLSKHSLTSALVLASLMGTVGCDDPPTAAAGQPNVVVGIGPIQGTLGPGGIEWTVGKTWAVGLGPVRAGVVLTDVVNGHDTQGALVVLAYDEAGSTAEAYKIGHDSRELCVDLSGKFGVRIRRDLIALRPTAATSTINISDPVQTGKNCDGTPVENGSTKPVPADTWSVGWQNFGVRQNVAGKIEICLAFCLTVG